MSKFHTHAVPALNVLYDSLVCLLQWLQSEFLKYLKDCENSVKDTDLEAQDQNKTMLSRETMEGLQIIGTIISRVILFVYELQFFSVKSFVEMTKYILSETSTDNSESLYFLSERISLDPIGITLGNREPEEGEMKTLTCINVCIMLQHFEYKSPWP